MKRDSLRAWLSLAMLLLASLNCRAPLGAPSGTSNGTPDGTSSETLSPVIIPTQPSLLPSATSLPATPLPTTPVQLPSSAPSALPLVDQFEIETLYFPQLITGLYHMYGKSIDSLVQVEVANLSGKIAHLRIENEILGFSSPAVSTMILEPGETLMVEHNPLFLPGAIDGLMNQRPATLSTDIHLIEDRQEIELFHQTDQVILYARRDFPSDLYPPRPFMFVAKYMAAWVTPHDPAIERLLRSAANWHPDGLIASGYNYQNDDFDQDVLARLEAIWKAIANDYGVTYVSTVVSFAPGAVQRIRLPGEVLEQRSGNCIELALLLASAAEAIELQPVIKFIPGHAYLGVRTGWESSGYYFIETTLIGRASIYEAIEEGNRKFYEGKNHIAGEGYFSVSISEARSLDILPMPWR